MDAIVDKWVAGNRLLIKHLRITDMSIPPEIKELKRNAWHIIISNHQSWADIIVLQNSFLSYAPPLKFFTKKELIWVPLIGLALWFLGFPYVRRLNADRLAANPHLRELDKNATLKACKGFLERPTSVLNFVEGTRFTPSKHETEKPPFVHLLKPKVGGLLIVSEALGHRIDRIIDVTIIYEPHAPTFWDFLCGRCNAVSLSVEFRNLPNLNRNDMNAWINKAWKEKDTYIETNRQSHDEESLSNREHPCSEHA